MNCVNFGWFSFLVDEGRDRERRSTRCVLRALARFAHENEANGRGLRRCCRGDVAFVESTSNPTASEVKPSERADD